MIINSPGVNYYEKRTDEEIKSIASTISSYNAFCTNANIDSLDSAFGKNNVSEIKGLGKALAMYAYFKGESATSKPYTELKKCSTLSDITSNLVAFGELCGSESLRNLVKASPYAKSVIIGDENYELCVLSGVAGIVPAEGMTLSSVMSTIAANQTKMNAFFNSQDSMLVVYNNYSASLLSTITGSAYFETSAKNSPYYTVSSAYVEGIHINEENYRYTIYGGKCFVLGYSEKNMPYDYSKAITNTLSGKKEVYKYALDLSGDTGLVWRINDFSETANLHPCYYDYNSYANITMYSAYIKIT